MISTVYSGATAPTILILKKAQLHWREKLISDNVDEISYSQFSSNNYLFYLVMPLSVSMGQHPLWKYRLYVSNI
jgi:hypothetical protein